MTTPDDPTRASDTGWPADPTAPLAPPAASEDPVAPATAPSDVAEEWTPEAEPELFAEEDAVEAAASDAAQDWTPEGEAEAQAELEGEAGPEPDPDELPASEPGVALAAAESDAAEVPVTDGPVEAPAYAEIAEPEVPVDAQDEAAAYDETAEPDAAAEGELLEAEAAAPAAEQVDERPERAGRRLTAPVVALLLTALLMAVANGFVWFRVHQHNATDDARRAGLEASRDAARVLFSYDYRTLEKNFSAGRALTTGAFAKEYAETTAKVVTDVAKQKKAVVKAEVVTAGVVRASTSTVVTIVYVNQVTTSSLAATPKVDLSRVRMTMTKVGDDWRVSKVDAL